MRFTRKQWTSYFWSYAGVVAPVTAALVAVRDGFDFKEGVFAIIFVSALGGTVGLIAGGIRLMCAYYGGKAGRYVCRPLRSRRELD